MRALRYLWWLALGALVAFAVGFIVAFAHRLITPDSDVFRGPTPEELRASREKLRESEQRFQKLYAGEQQRRAREERQRRRESGGGEPTRFALLGTYCRPPARRGRPRRVRCTTFYDAQTASGRTFTVKRRWTRDVSRNYIYTPDRRTP